MSQIDETFMPLPFNAQEGGEDLIAVADKIANNEATYQTGTKCLTERPNQKFLTI